MKTAIWWVRRDLRLRDNPALAAAIQAADEVLPVFILDPSLLESDYVGEKRLGFLYDGLHALDEDLQAIGSGLCVRRGEPLEQLASLVTEAEAGRIFAQEEYSPYGRARDQRVGQSLALKLTPGLSARHPNEVLKDGGDPYTVFTPFSRRWKEYPALDNTFPAPDRLDSPDIPSSVRLADLSPPATGHKAGEREAERRLLAFVEGQPAPIHSYADLRNRTDLDGTSQLSPYLRFGMLSPRVAALAAIDAGDSAPDASGRKGAETWLNELIWREFFLSILYHYPRVLKESFRTDLQGLRWANDREEFEAWCQGHTGYPIVDAAMRQLAETGWMHNRARMIVASFLTKDLLIDWRWGERWFMQHLVDGDPASNNGGWQWTAGTGTDAAPYFRIFNPVLQGEKHDPQGDFTRRWVPELRTVPDKYLQRPWTMPEDAQREAGCLIGQDYPTPLVDHKWARERTLAAYKQARESASG